MATPNTYKYHPLDPGNSEFRLVTLEPGCYSDPIHCRLHNVSLHLKPRFEALSYTWGPSQPQTSILISNSRFRIRKNLELALRHLRHEEQIRVLWIDALSINQAEVLERNHQVQSMKEIFSAADAVIVWLGPEADNSSIAISFMKKIAEKLHNGRTYSYTKLLTENMTPECAKALKSLYNREYWLRAWIVQEILVAKSFSVHAGEQSIGGEDFVKFQQCVEQTGLINEVSPSQAGSFDSADPEDRKGDIADVSEVKMQTVNPCWIALRALLSEKDLEVRHWLFTVRHRKASDPRDVLYALYGITKSRGAGDTLAHHIDYQLPKVEVYINFILLCEKHEVDMWPRRPMTIICLREPYRTDGNLPSWVPDFSNSDAGNSTLQLGTFRRPSALGSYNRSTPLRVGQSTDGFALYIRGFVLDGVRQVGPIASKHRDVLSYERGWIVGNERLMHSVSPDMWEAFASWVQLVADGERRSMTKLELPPKKIDAFGRCICTGLGPYREFGLRRQIQPMDICHLLMSHAFADSSVDSLSHYLRRKYLDGVLSEKDLVDIKDFMIVWAEATRNRRFGILYRGTYVLAPAETRPSDLVCLLFECDFPVVLRKVGSHYVFIGECYVSGYMDGKAMVGLERGEREPIEFNIY
ncbi:MAG: hypothetical protein M1821_003352 [Bathelium mastoideum]|nr:MAG: hypothetical protein M1821_003352 [Bathelium mastoideum]